MPPYLKGVATQACEISLYQCLQSNNWKQNDFCKNTF